MSTDCGVRIPFFGLTGQIPRYTGLRDLARKLELGSVAVGVEGEAALSIPKVMGCGSVQGFHISRPVAPERIPAAIEEWASRSAGAVA